MVRAILDVSPKGISKKEIERKLRPYKADNDEQLVRLS